MKGLFDFDNFDTTTKVVVIGVGGAGCNAINKMIDEQILNVKFYALNTDRQALASNKAQNRILLGEETTHGIGAGGHPEIGKQAALESIDTIKEIVSEADLVFIAAGMGGGTGTGASPIIAKVAKEAGAIVVGVATRPFLIEGTNRNQTAIIGINEFKNNTDSLIIVSNDKLLMVNGNMPIYEAFKEADNVLMQVVKMISELILKPGLMNIDFADIKNILKDGGYALIGFGKGKGEFRAEQAAKSALSSPLSDQSFMGATKGICHLITGPKVSLYDSTAVISKIIEYSKHQLNIKFGISVDDKLDDEIRVSLIASGFKNNTDFSKPNVNLFNDYKDTSKDIDQDDITPSFLNNKDI